MPGVISELCPPNVVASASADHAARHRLPRLIGLALAATLLLGACARLGASAADPQAQYQTAIRDAETAESSEISTQLTPIIAANETLVWRGTPGASAVLVVTWGGVDRFTRPGDTLTTDLETWVTVVPEVRARCQTLDLEGQRLSLRLKQLLGLPPDSSYTRFAELWVAPTDLFRPCPDPEITDRECERDFPRSERFITVSDEHKWWFRRMKRTMYGPAGYPWTRLGYTYDWGRSDTEFGFSEFVIREGASVVVHALASTAAYCRPDR